MCMNVCMCVCEDNFASVKDLDMQVTNPFMTVTLQENSCCRSYHYF